MRRLLECGADCGAYSFRRNLLHLGVLIHDYFYHSLSFKMMHSLLWREGETESLSKCNNCRRGRGYITGNVTLAFPHCLGPDARPVKVLCAHHCLINAALFGACGCGAYLSVYGTLENMQHTYSIICKVAKKSCTFYFCCISANNKLNDINI